MTLDELLKEADGADVDDKEKASSLYQAMTTAVEGAKSNGSSAVKPTIGSRRD